VRSREELHAYWRDPDEANRPEGYAVPVERSRFLLTLLEPYCALDDAVLEIGPNVGRNLEHLRLAGFKHLEGIEISSNAIDVMRATYPELAASATIHNAPVEEVIRTLPDAKFGAVFTMAVLEHIHPESEWIFAEMVRICRGVILTIEDEASRTWRHTPREYRSVFEGLGMAQIAEAQPGGSTGLGRRFRARIFRRPEA
jgi:SAM-dependent methyltransferase